MVFSSLPHYPPIAIRNSFLRATVSKSPLLFLAAFSPNFYSHFALVSDRHYLFVMGDPLNLHDAAYVLGGRVGVNETHCCTLET